jgi:hypothetical protein
MITIYDQEGNIMVEENQATASLKVNTSILEGVLLSNNEAQASKGIFYFNNVLLIAKPGSLLKLSLQFRGIETYSNPVEFIDQPIQVSVTTRDCVSGEEYTTDGRCLKCERDKYLYEPPTKPTACKDCNQAAKCFSGNLVAPLDGYWRSSNTSDNFIECPRTSSCRAGNESFLTGICADGY